MARHRGRSKAKPKSSKRRSPRRKSKESVKIKGPATVKIVRRQTGGSNLKIDRRQWALPPGKRVSRTGNIYYEYRRNRSDLEPIETPTGEDPIERHARMVRGRRAGRRKKK